MQKLRKLIRWAILLASIGGALYLYSVAIYCSWAAGGPPTNYPESWRQYAYIYRGYSGATLAFGIFCFSALRENFNWKRSVALYLCVPAIIYFLAAPKVHEYILIDKCLDSGSRWDSKSFKCLPK